MKTTLATLVGFLLLQLPAFATAALVEYEWNVYPRRSREPLSPDCFTDRDMLLVNDMLPGPEIRAKVGDTIRVTVVNHSPSEALTIHYHGISMYQQPYHDGAGTRSQCNVGPMQVCAVREEDERIVVFGFFSQSLTIPLSISLYRAK